MCLGWHLGKIGQDEASCDGLLVVKLVVKRDWLTTKTFLTLHKSSQKYVLKKSRTK